MKIECLKISGIGGIRELSLTFNPGFNAICGPNGIGKSTILTIIANAFASNSAMIKRNAAYEVGKYSIQFTNLGGVLQEKNQIVTEFAPQKAEHNYNACDETSYIMYFKENRIIDYSNLNSIPRDVDSNKYTISLGLETGISVMDLKGWFDNRCLFGALGNSLTVEQTANLELAKRSFSILDPSIVFKTVESSSLDIILSSRNGDIYFEYLSSGYKSCIYLILGLFKEIEFRFGKGCMKAQEFDGVVLIDEIDVHLHPTWQARLVEALKDIFPKAQFITTTHSPSVLQTLEKAEIIPLTQDDIGNVFVKELNLTEYGLQGWSIEEILRDVMEMPETTSKLYEETKRAFEKAIIIEDIKTARSCYELLKKMLHPDSVVGKVLDIQVAGLGEE